MSPSRAVPSLAALAAATTFALAAAPAQAAPGSVAVGPDGTAYASDLDSSVITKIAADGTIGASFGGRGATPARSPGSPASTSRRTRATSECSTTPIACRS